MRLESEATLRNQVAEELPFTLLEEVPMLDRSGNATLALVVRFPELTQMILHYLDQHQEAGSLTWHGTLPEDECLVKIRGDHGGQLFKFSFQVANVNQPNAFRNTIPFLAFGAKDTPENLATALKPYA